MHVCKYMCMYACMFACCASPDSLSAEVGFAIHIHNQSCLRSPFLFRSMARLPDVKQPTKPGNVFMFYLQANKARFLEQAGGVYKQAVSLCSKDWQVLPKDDRAPYEKKAKEAKKQYDEDVKAFIDGGGAMKQCKASKGRDRRKTGQKNKNKDAGTGQKNKNKDAGAPQKPVGGAFGCFLRVVWCGVTRASKGDQIGAAARQASRKGALGSLEKALHKMI